MFTATHDPYEKEGKIRKTSMKSGCRPSGGTRASTFTYTENFRQWICPHEFHWVDVPIRESLGGLPAWQIFLWVRTLFKYIRLWVSEDAQQICPHLSIPFKLYCSHEVLWPPQSHFSILLWEACFQDAASKGGKHRRQLMNIFYWLRCDTKKKKENRRM